MTDYKVGDTIEVTIQSVGKKGDGISKVENKVIFVSDVTEGATLSVKITKLLEHVIFAEKA